MKLVLNVRGNQGYGPDQVRGMNVRELIEMLEGYEPDTEIVLNDVGNTYGAAWGNILDVEENFADEGEE